jgi:hypothetical protein
LEVEFLPVYKPSEEERANPVLFANNVRAGMTGGWLVGWLVVLQQQLTWYND